MDNNRTLRKGSTAYPCPVPGCGSSRFTTCLHLKRHMCTQRGTFICKWSDCGRRFSRQHDCKHHESLHLNIQLYMCVTCKKIFETLDALNRHREPLELLSLLFVFISYTITTVRSEDSTRWIEAIIA
ncbi:hypothetical protein M422DRAFT_182609 [Sphaerobolus stellatus SS14]|uniref:C2H2-type domain-containing protein n=1 Tax=Sphaerobolus stellatus (strain SS14) TaxID=990650 RepID=A0A0C9V9P3_SPHS4|nr:hypothetical protein M422DRAFT_182609 [Sphaerobolus stellatus SS14]